MEESSKHVTSRGLPAIPGTAAPIALLFFLTGFLSLATALVVLLQRPDILLGDPYRPEVLAIAHLLLLGFIGSLVFGASYMILPVIASASLWSRKLAWAHLALHAIGMVWMVVAMAQFNFMEAMQGGNAVFLGMMLYVVNLMFTASARNRWEPEQISFITGFFWLCLASALAIFMLVNKFVPMTALDTQWLMALHAHLGLVGFYWLVLLGAGLKLFAMFLISSKSPGFFSWMGVLTINAGLMLMIPMEFNQAGSSLQSVAWMLLAGSLFYFVDLLRLFLSSKRKMDGSMATAAAGILFGLLILGWILAGMPTTAWAEQISIREKVRVYFTLTVFGTYSLAILGMGTRIIPFLVWQIRYADKIGKEKVPTASELTNPQSRWVMFLCLVLGWLYLAAAQISNYQPGIQLALLCFAVGFAWFIYTIVPSIKAMVSSSALESPAQT